MPLHALPALVEVLVLSGRGIRFGVPGHYGLFEETPTLEAAIALARKNLAKGHACACVAIRIEAKIIDGIGDGTDRELVRFEIYHDRVALVPEGQGGLSDGAGSQGARAAEEGPFVTQYYLITNLDIVTITGGTPDIYGSTDVHLHASAILLMRDDHSPRKQGGQCMIRLFGPDAAWPITSLAVGSIVHEISPIPHPYDMPGVIQVSYDLIVDGRLHLKLFTESQDGAPPDVTAYPTGTPIHDIWEALHEKAAAHWGAPHMPLLQWVPIDYARQRSKASHLPSQDLPPGGKKGHP